MNTFLPANMLTNKDKVISLRDDTVKVSDENADRTTMVKPPSSSYSARVKVHIKPLGIKFVEKIDSSACPTIRDFVERQLLLGGYARAYPFDDTDTFENLFAQDELTARENGVGGWSSCQW